jgi:hypothetical protein
MPVRALEAVEITRAGHLKFWRQSLWLPHYSGEQIDFTPHRIKVNAGIHQIDDYGCVRAVTCPKEPAVNVVGVLDGASKPDASSDYRWAEANAPRFRGSVMSGQTRSKWGVSSGV